MMCKGLTISRYVPASQLRLGFRDPHHGAIDPFVTPTLLKCHDLKPGSVT